MSAFLQLLGLRFLNSLCHLPETILHRHTLCHDGAVLFLVNVINFLGKPVHTLLHYILIYIDIL